MDGFRRLVMCAAVVLVGVAVPSAPGTAAPTGMISGVVVDAFGNPLHDAELHLGNKPAVAGTSGADGTFTLGGLGGGGYSVCASGATAGGGASTTGYRDSCAYDISLDAGGSVTDVTVTLAAAGAIDGTVQDDQGHPLDGATVHVEQLGVSPGYTATTTSGADGSYFVKSLPAANYLVCFDAADATGGASMLGYAAECWDDVPDPPWGMSFNDVTPVAVTDGASVDDVSAVMSPAGAISGTVTDTAGQPLAGVRVNAIEKHYSGGMGIAQTTTAPDGSFRMAGLAPSDRYTLCFGAQSATGGTSVTGYLNQCFGGGSDIYDATDFAVTAGATTTGRDAQLLSAGRISGVVSDADGAPIAGVRVYASEEEGSLTAADTTDEQGRYTVNFDDPNASAGSDARAYATRLPIAPYRLYFNAPAQSGFLSQYHDGVIVFGNTGSGNLTLVTPTAGTGTTINEQLTRASAISGTVTGGGGPLSEVEVTVTRIGDGSLSYTDTDADGRYSFPQVPAGEYRVCFAAGYADGGDSPAGYLDECYDNRAENAADTISLDLAEHRTVNAELTSGAGIAGNVTDTTGAPASQVKVTVRRGGNDIAESDTSSSGGYFVRRLRPGTYTVCFENEFSTAIRSYDPECFDNVLPGGEPTPVPAVAGELAHVDAALTSNSSPPDDEAPLVRMRAPTSEFRASPRIEVAYSGSDDGSGIASYDVRWRSAPWNGVFSGYHHPASWRGVTGESLAFTGAAGRTYCFSVRARDLEGNLSAYSPERCTVVPIDDARLVAGPNWRRVHVAGAYGGTVTRTNTKGARLRLPGAQFRRLALVVTTCRVCGRVAIYYGGHFQRSVNTHSATTNHRVVLLQPEVGYRRADITLEDSSSGRLEVDGLAVTRLGR